jgi:hypothetical protein
LVGNKKQNMIFVAVNSETENGVAAMQHTESNQIKIKIEDLVYHNHNKRETRNSANLVYMNKINSRNIINELLYSYSMVASKRILSQSLFNRSGRGGTARKKA